MKLWCKDEKRQENPLTRKVERFTAGKDPDLDQRLVAYDCQASVAHARELQRQGILTIEELELLISGLSEITRLAAKGGFRIGVEDEDCHTAIENHLIRRLGELGKKLHTCRSRNDQVLTALRLYELEELFQVRSAIAALMTALTRTGQEQGTVSLPGYTHLRKAMPTTVGDWLGAYHRALEDDLVLLEVIRRLIDRCPLGSAAGFGVPLFKLDRAKVASELGFSGPLEPVTYTQLGRGKLEAGILHLMSQIMHDLNRLATDLITFSTSEFGYLHLPEAMCTGSSIMPQKVNPDVCELVRGYYHVVVAEELKVKGLVGNLTGAYHRELQLTKEPVRVCFDIIKDCLELMAEVVSGLRMDQGRCEEGLAEGSVFATERAYRLVKESGIPFREAYRAVALSLDPEPNQ